MKKLLILLIAISTSIGNCLVQGKSLNQKLTKDQAWQLLEKTCENSYVKVLPPNLLATAAYKDMASEGWTLAEIVRLTDEYLAAHKPELKKEGTNVEYAKYWRPYNVSTSLMNATLPEYANPEQMKKASATVEATQADPHAYYPRIFYTVNDRLAGKRNPGYFRHNTVMPAGGRIHWIAVHPDNADRLMVVPDGEGIWRTDDMGKHWDCITERIPNRYDRNQVDGYSIPVDPDNWDNIYAFMANSTVYKTFDAGQTWTKVVGATHKGFKRGYCYRDARGKLRFIGAKPGTNGVGSQLWVSSDTCKTWKSITLTTAQKDITVNGTATFWFQEIAFHPTNRDIVYSAGSRGILRSVDGGDTWDRMTFKVYGATTATVRAESTNLFPLATANTPMFLAVNPTNGNEIWAALSTRENAGFSALYKTTDGGQSWITLQEPSAGIGSGGIFGNESAWNWLGGFAVNFADPRYVYGCSMSSAESSNSGIDFTEFSWPTRSSGFYPDGNIYTVSSASHNADNHVLKGHKSGRIFRGGDAGLIMKDKNINGYQWTNIAGDMGEMMFYTSATNEFGDFAITGNTQDINIETYRGGRWGASRGYEGSTIWMNPFSGEEHFPYLTSGGTAIQNQDYGSWSRAWTQADVCTGNWFIRREGTNPDGSRFSVIKDFGKSSIAIDNASAGWVQDFALSRDVPGGKLFIVRNNKVYVSTNSGATFTAVNTGTLSVTKIAVNPDNSKEIYLAKDGAVYSTLNGGTSWQTISTAALSGIPVKSFYYHEGSGDLYFVSATQGIFIREANTTEWKLWTMGYNTAKLADAQINYTTQEMIITDYGSGIWIADLAHPADRYLKNGFALKQTSNINNARTFGIDIHYTIPLYYYFKWYVNGVLQTKENGQYFSSSDLKAGDKLKLEVTLRESPDITTTSAEYTVADEATTTIQNSRGNYLYSNQRGRLDLGYVDQFFGNFTLQMWVNPKSDGVIIANRQVNTGAVKGFYVSVNSGKLNFTYAPQNNFSQPYNETSKASQFSLDGGAIALNTWSHIAITHDRSGSIKLYVDGVLKATQARALPAFTLNNSLYLSLFADGYELNPIDGSVDELQIWNDVLDQTDIRKSMYASIAPVNAKQIYYNDFNAATLAQQKERYSQKGMMPRVDAQVTVNESALGTCANSGEYKALTNAWTSFANKGVTAMDVKSNDIAFKPNVSGLVYEGNLLGTATNLSPDYYTIYPMAYGIKMFDATDLTKTVDVKFYLDPSSAATFEGAKLYALDLNASREYWTALTSLTYNSADNSVSATAIKASDINNKRLLVVKSKPAIEFNSASIGVERQLYVYSPDTTKVTFQATVVGGLQSPATYNLISSSPVVKKLDPLTFANNTATSTASVVLDDNGMFNQSTAVTISGEDTNLMPFSFNVINKMTSKTNEKGIKLNKGGANIGSASAYAALSGKNTATYMAWIRLDDATMLTGYKMLLFFRGTGTNATGLVIKDGKIGCHWNDESWSWDVNSGLTLTSADVGKWVHIAMTAAPSGLNFYLNGKKGTQVGSNLSSPLIKTNLMLGKNFDGDANFIGAFDQVAIWNRTLTQQEIVKYMHSRVLLNDPGLISYVPFDKEETGGGYLDMKSNTMVTFNGVVEKNIASYLPFNFVSQQARTRTANDGIINDGVSFTLPGTYPTTSAYYSSRFTGSLYNSIDVKYPKQVALEGGFRTISLGAIRTFTSTERVQLSVENPTIVAGDSVILYARSLGSVGSFTNRYSVLGTTGKASFDVPATLFNENLTYMLFRLPAPTNALENAEVYRYKMSVDNGTCTISNLRGNATITVYNLCGKVISNTHENSTHWSTSLSSGIYLIRIDESGVACMTKVAL